MHKRPATRHRASQLDDMCVQPMQDTKGRISAKTFASVDWNCAQLLHRRPFAGKTENRIRSSPNARPNPKSLAHHPRRGGSLANIENFSLGKTVAERRHHERSALTNDGFDGFDQEIQPPVVGIGMGMGVGIGIGLRIGMEIGHRGKLRRHNSIGMRQNHASRRDADRKQSIGDSRRCDRVPSHAAIRGKRNCVKFPQSFYDSPSRFSGQPATVKIFAARRSADRVCKSTPS